MQVDKKETKAKFDKLVEKYNIDIEKLKKEQEKLAKELKIENIKNYDNIERVSAIENTFVENRIISGIVVISNDEIVEQEYNQDKVKFPYLSGFRAYRELPNMVECFNKLEEKSELVLIHGHGISHERLGLASHFSLSVGVPTIGVAESLLVGEIKGKNIILNGKKVGEIIQAKRGSKPLYVSAGNLISVETAVEIIKKLIKEGHKLPEIMRKAHKYVGGVRKELFN